jgi:hypothetical protein
VENLARQLRRNPFRTFVHSASAMDHVIRRAGLELVSRSCTWTWCADVWSFAPRRLTFLPPGP